MIEKIKEISKQYARPCVLSSHENLFQYNEVLTIDMGSKYNLDEIAKNIFTCLRKADAIAPDIIIIEGVEKRGIGVAIMNRLLKACKDDYVEV